MTGQARSKTNQ